MRKILKYGVTLAMLLVTVISMTHSTHAYSNRIFFSHPWDTSWDTPLPAKSSAQPYKYSGSEFYKFHPIIGPLTTKSELKQFIGSYNYDGYISSDDHSIYNIVSDSKSCTSLFYHLPFVNNHRRSEQKNYGILISFIYGNRLNKTLLWILKK